MTATAVAPIPTARDERWHYAPLDEITARLQRSVAPSPGDPAARVAPSQIDALAAAAGPRLVFVNGEHSSALSDLDGLPIGVRCGVSGMNQGSAAGTATVTVDDGVRCEELIHVVHIAAPDAGATRSVLSRPRTTIVVGAGARVSIVETFGGPTGSTSPAFTEAATQVRLGDDSELALYRIQIEPPQVTHVGRTRIDQGARSVMRMTSVTLGGDIARNAVEVRLDAPDAAIELTGIDVARGRQRHDTVVTVEHAASRCSSSQRFNAVVDHHARASFSGEIIVEPGTTGTDAHQSSRSLVLDRNAEADSRPWLRILADDVRCTHGAAVGRLDDDALHYLRSRGVPLAAARAMLIDAFLGDITDSITDARLRAHVAGVVSSTVARR